MYAVVVQWLGRCPLKAEAGVQLPATVLVVKRSILVMGLGVRCNWKHACVGLDGLDWLVLEQEVWSESNPHHKQFYAALVWAVLVDYLSVAQLDSAPGSYPEG